MESTVFTPGIEKGRLRSTDNRTGNHEFDCADVHRQECDHGRNQNGDRRKIRNGMRRHLAKFNYKNSHYRWSDAFHVRRGPRELSDAFKDWKNRQRDDERR